MPGTRAGVCLDKLGDRSRGPIRVFSSRSLVQQAVWNGFVDFFACVHALCCHDSESCYHARACAHKWLRARGCGLNLRFLVVGTTADDESEVVIVVASSVLAAGIGRESLPSQLTQRLKSHHGTKFVVRRGS